MIEGEKGFENGVMAGHGGSVDFESNIPGAIVRQWGMTLTSQRSASLVFSDGKTLTLDTYIGDKPIMNGDEYLHIPA